ILDGRLGDFNNDGLADFLVGPELYYNSGFGSFDDHTIILTSFSQMTKQQQFPAYPRDFDGDGLFDLSCLDGNCSLALSTSASPMSGRPFGPGGGFNPPASTADSRLEQFSATPWYQPPEWIGRTAKITQNDNPSTPCYSCKVKKTLRDFIDLDGDGVAERYQLIANGLSVESWHAAPGS